VKCFFHALPTLLSNGKGYTQVMQELNAMGYRTRNGNHFGKNSIHEILRNEKYAGTFIFNRSAAKGVTGKRNNHQNKSAEDIIRIEGAIEPIVDADTFQAVTRIIGSLRRQSPCNAIEKYLLVGKVYCGDCGAAYNGNRKLSGRNKRLLVTYRCGGSQLKGRVDCRNKEINRDRLEAFVLAELERVIFSNETVTEIVRQYQSYCTGSNHKAAEQAELLQSKIAAAQKKIDNLVNIMAETGSRNLVAAMQKLELEQNQLEAELAKIQSAQSAKHITEEQIRLAYQRARQQFVSGDLQERQTLIHHYLSRVVIYKEHIAVFINRLPTYLLRLDERLLTNRSDTKIPRFSAQNGGKVGEAGGGEGS